MFVQDRWKEKMKTRWNLITVILGEALLLAFCALIILIALPPPESRLRATVTAICAARAAVGIVLTLLLTPLYFRIRRVTKA